MMSDSKALKETWFLKRKNGRLIADDETLNKAEQYSIGYKEFLDVAKTEREAVKEAVYLAENQGFKDQGFRVIVNCGKDGGQEVGHLHFHLLAGTQLGEKIV